jgi:tetratricopeptide (TPR) repeat protein
MRIEDQVVELSKASYDPQVIFDTALAYEALDQKASAISFYLRAAEYGAKTHQLIVYTSLLKMAKLFEGLNNRKHTVISCWRQAITVDPYRPEAYFFMAQKYEQEGAWQESYMWASMGLANVSSEPLPTDVGYPGVIGLKFEQAVCGWWIGRREESIGTFEALLKEDIPDTYRTAIQANLEKIL